VLLLILASLWVLVAENEVNLVTASIADRKAFSAVASYLVGGTTLVGAEHDDVGRGVGEFLGLESLGILEKLHVSTTTLEAVCVIVLVLRLRFNCTRETPTLKLDLILYNKGFSLVVNGLRKLRRDSVMGCLVLDNQALVAFNALQHRGLLDSPVAHILPFLGRILSNVFLCM